MVLIKQFLSVTLCYALAFSAFAQQPAQTAAGTRSAAPSPAEMQQLVAPIALYPDALLAQILAASTYPTQVVEAARWVQQNSNLQGQAFAAAVDKQPWDASIKGLTQFPSVLENMNKNLSWTSSLGDAYYNVPEDVTAAIQALRQEAQQAGNLQSTPQQTVTTEGQTIVIQPANPEVVYVPSYSPSVVYGEPIAAYPGYSGWGVAAASALSFGAGVAVGAAFGSPWGWGHWGYNWHGGNAQFNRNTFISNSNTFANRNTNFSQFNRNNVNRNAANLQNRQAAGNLQNRQAAGNLQNRQAAGNLNANRSMDQFNRQKTGQGLAGAAGSAQNFNRGSFNSSASRGFGQMDRASSGAHSGAYSGFGQGGSARMESSRGSSSFSGARSGGFSGGGASRGGGGGGFRGGGGGRGGGRR
jgi:hypothetical protein